MLLAFLRDVSYSESVSVYLKGCYRNRLAAAKLRHAAAAAIVPHGTWVSRFDQSLAHRLGASAEMSGYYETRPPTVRLASPACDDSAAVWRGSSGLAFVSGVAGREREPVRPRSPRCRRLARIGSTRADRESARREREFDAGPGALAALLDPAGV